jgi:hypothetical protein
LSRRALQASRDWDHFSASPWCDCPILDGRRLAVVGAHPPDYGGIGDKFGVLKDLLLLLWLFVYSLSPPLFFLLSPALELCTFVCELAAYVRKLRRHGLFRVCGPDQFA